MGHATFDLRFDRADSRGKQTPDAKSISLASVECHTLVPKRVMQNINAKLFGLQWFRILDTRKMST